MSIISFEILYPADLFHSESFFERYNIIYWFQVKKTHPYNSADRRVSPDLGFSPVLFFSVSIVMHFCRHSFSLIKYCFWFRLWFISPLFSFVSNRYLCWLNLEIKINIPVYIVNNVMKIIFAKEQTIELTILF